MQVALLAACSKKPPEDFASHMNVPFDHRVPEYFETYLAEHPDDGDHRAAALVYYDRRERNPERLKYHTFEMIERRPWNLNIYFENVGSCTQIQPTGRTSSFVSNAKRPSRT
jgi:hypothetical protein